MATKNEIEVLTKIISNDDFIDSFNLSERDKAILQMRCLFKQTFGVIGKQFNISDEMVRVIYNRILNKLSQNINTINNLTATEPYSKQTALNSKKEEHIRILNLAELSNKCKTELKYKNIETLQQLTIFTSKDILSFRGFGNKMLEEIENALAQNNLSLAKL